MSLEQKEKYAQLSGYVNYLKNNLLVKGYYFSFSYMLSLSKNAYSGGYPSNKKFIWNMNIAQNLIKLQDKKWFVPMIQGFIGTFSVTIQGKLLEYTLITRRSWSRGGTRFNSRGIDLKGDVANFS